MIRDCSMNHFLQLIYCGKGGTCQQLFYHIVTVNLFDIFFLQNCVIMVVVKWIKCKDSITIVVCVLPAPSRDTNIFMHNVPKFWKPMWFTSPYCSYITCHIDYIVIYLTEFYSLYMPNYFVCLQNITHIMKSWY